jgi:hypothetical protein
VWFLAVLCVLSLLYFNRNAGYENYFIYFIGSYGLGILAQLCKNYPDRLINRFARVVMGAIGMAIIVASFQEFWLRNILAYVVALVLILWGDWTYIDQWRDQKYLRPHKFVNAILWSSRRSYCAFLIHFAFILLANTLYIGWGMSRQHDGVMAIVLMCFSLVASWQAANYLYRWVEVPARRIKF